MTFKRATLLAFGMLFAGAAVGFLAVQVPRAMRGQVGENDRLGDIKRRLPNAITPGGGPSPGMVIPPFLRGELGLTGTQHQRVADLERETADRLSEILTPDQMLKFEELMRRGPDRPMFDQ